MLDLNDFRIVVGDWVKEPVLLCTHEYFNYLKDLQESNEDTFTVTDLDNDRINYYKIQDYIERELVKFCNVRLIDVKFHQDKYGEISNVDYILELKEDNLQVSKVESIVSMNVWNFCNRYGLTGEFYNINFIIR